MDKDLSKRSMFRMALSNLDAWLNSPRVLLMALCVIVYGVMLAVGDRQGFWAAGISVPLTLPEKLFVNLYNSFYNMGSLLFLVMVSEVPRRIPFQHVMLIRSTRRKWVASQCLYCAMMVLLTMALLSAVYTLIILPGSSLNAAFTDDGFIAAGLYEQEESFIPAYIRQHFTPWSACAFTAIPMFFFWYTMALVILLCSMLGHPLLGPSIYGSILMGKTTILMECLPHWLKLPTDFSSLGAIVQNCAQGELRHAAFVLAIYLGVVAAMILLLMRIASHADFTFFDEKHA